MHASPAPGCSHASSACLLQPAPDLPPCPAPPRSTYTDDGLRAKMAPLMATASDLTTDLSYMRELLKVPGCLGVCLPACLLTMGAPCAMSSRGASLPARLGAAPARCRQRAAWPLTFPFAALPCCAAVQAARAELYLLSRPHTFPTQQYQ